MALRKEKIERPQESEAKHAADAKRTKTNSEPAAEKLEKAG